VKKSLPTPIVLCTISCPPPRIDKLRWPSVQLQHSSQFEEAVGVLEQRRVKYVLWDTQFQAKKVAALLPASARMPRGALIIEPYMESHYKVVWEDAIHASWSGRVKAMRTSENHHPLWKFTNGPGLKRWRLPHPIQRRARQLQKRRSGDTFVFAIHTLCQLVRSSFMRLLLGNGDEGLLVYGAVRIAHGQVFARDFFEMVGPGTFYWLASSLSCSA